MTFSSFPRLLPLLSLPAVVAVAAFAGSPAHAGEYDKAVNACRAAVAEQAGQSAVALRVDRIRGGGRVTKVWLSAEAGRYLCVAGSTGEVRDVTPLDGAGASSPAPAQ
ncbi:hypothetical protein [Parapedomonas caeni]